MFDPNLGLVRICILVRNVVEPVSLCRNFDVFEHPWAVSSEGQICTLHGIRFIHHLSDHDDGRWVGHQQRLRQN